MKLKELLDKWEPENNKTVVLDIIEIHETTLYENMTVESAIKNFGWAEVEDYFIDEDGGDITLNVRVWG